MVSTVIATLFLRTTLHSNSVSDGQTYLGLIFFAIIHMVCQKLPLHMFHSLQSFSSFHICLQQWQYCLQHAALTPVYMVFCKLLARRT